MIEPHPGTALIRTAQGGCAASWEYPGAVVTAPSSRGAEARNHGLHGRGTGVSSTRWPPQAASMWRPTRTRSNSGSAKGSAARRPSGDFELPNATGRKVRLRLAVMPLFSARRSAPVAGSSYLKRANPAEATTAATLGAHQPGDPATADERPCGTSCAGFCAWTATGENRLGSDASIRKC
jgi:hypothetical protein